jgi:hypothetical protein
MASDHKYLLYELGGIHTCAVVLMLAIHWLGIRDSFFEIFCHLNEGALELLHVLGSFLAIFWNIL